MSYLDTLTRASKSPATDYHSCIFANPKARKHIYDFFIGEDCSDILADIQALAKDLSHFEKKYNQNSESIYTAYINGEEPEDDNFVLDFGEWASVYQMWLNCNVEYRDKLKEFQKQTPNLAGSIQVDA